MAGLVPSELKFLALLPEAVTSGVLPLTRMHLRATGGPELYSARVRTGPIKRAYCLYDRSIDNDKIGVNRLRAPWQRHYLASQQDDGALRQ
jgi:hypothetical protein